MTPTYPMHYTDNARSWSRMWMLLRLYWPGLRPGFIILAVAPIVLLLITGIIMQTTGDGPSLKLSWVLGMMFYLAPVMLARRDYRPVGSQLPVTAGEKLGFLLGMFCVVMPIVMNASCLVGELLVKSLCTPHVYDSMDSFFKQFTLGQMTWITTILWYVSLEAIVLYYVVTARHNRFGAGLLSLFVSYCSMMLLVGLGGAIVGVRAGMEAVEVGGNDEKIFCDTITHYTPIILSVGTCVLVIVGVIYLVKLYKYLRNGGF